jgi:hypothetical protein
MLRAAALLQGVDGGGFVASEPFPNRAPHDCRNRFTLAVRDNVERSSLLFGETDVEPIGTGWHLLGLGLVLGAGLVEHGDHAVCGERRIGLEHHRDLIVRGEVRPAGADFADHILDGGDVGVERVDAFRNWRDGGVHLDRAAGIASHERVGGHARHCAHNRRTCQGGLQ